MVEKGETQQTSYGEEVETDCLQAATEKTMLPKCSTE